jgi:SAM-dependent methyltransferase
MYSLRISLGLISPSGFAVDFGMSQNIYDDADFFRGYAALDRSTGGLDNAPEWPKLRSYIPSLQGARVLDLGCGYGWFSRWARSNGATTVNAFDLSANMLDRARSMTNDDRITYKRADLDAFRLPDEQEQAYDLVFSSLALHYLVNLRELVTEIYRALKPGGTFVFSIEHPIFTAPSNAQFITDEASGRDYWPLNDYQKEGLRVTDWLAEGVRKQHRTTATYINTLLGAGFELERFDEWYPTAEELEKYPWHRVLDRPIFLLMSVRKRAR